MLTVTDEEAYKMAKLLARTAGILVGITSGAALAAAVRLLHMPKMQKRSWRFCPTVAIVIFFPPRSLNKRKNNFIYGKKNTTPSAPGEKPAFLERGTNAVRETTGFKGASFNFPTLAKPKPICAVKTI